MFYLFNCPKRFFSICGVEHYILNDGDEGITKKGGIRIPPRKTFNIFKFLLILCSMPPSWPIMKRPWYLLSPVLLRGKQISGLLVSELRLFCSPILCWLLDGSAHMGLAYNGWWWCSRLPCSVCWQSRRWEPLISGGHTKSGIPHLVRTNSGITTTNSTIVELGNQLGVAEFYMHDS